MTSGFGNRVSAYWVFHVDQDSVATAPMSPRLLQRLPRWLRVPGILPRGTLSVACHHSFVPPLSSGSAHRDPSVNSLRTVCCSLSTQLQIRFRGDFFCDLLSTWHCYNSYTWAAWLSFQRAKRIRQIFPVYKCRGRRWSSWLFFRTVHVHAVMSVLVMVAMRSRFPSDQSARYACANHPDHRCSLWVTVNVVEDFERVAARSVGFDHSCFVEWRGFWNLIAGNLLHGSL